MNARRDSSSALDSSTGATLGEHAHRPHFHMHTGHRAPNLLHLLAPTLLAVLAPPVLAQSQAATVTSPNHRLQMQFAVLHNSHPTAKSGRLVYSLLFDGKPLLVDCGLSLSVAGGPLLGDKVQIEQVTPSTGVDDYNEVVGKTSHVHDAWSSLTLKVSEPEDPHRTMTIEARHYPGSLTEA